MNYITDREHQMDNIRRFTIAMAGLIATTAPGCNLLSSGTASQDLNGPTGPNRRLIILLDKTGSMVLQKNDPLNPTRFDAAKSASQDDLVLFTQDNVNPLLGVRVFTFNDVGITEQIPPNPDPITGQNPSLNHDGWFIPDAVNRMIGKLTTPELGTPLAGSICDASDQFNTPKPEAGSVDDILMLATYSDGGENNTAPNHPCFGLTTAAWEANAKTHLLNNGTVFNGTLFTDVSGPTPKPTQPAVEAAKLEGAPVPAASILTDAQAFADLAQATGGKFRLFLDNQRLPVLADVNGDFAVDRTDAILLARQFGRPADPQFDLNGDGVIDFKDYLILLARLGLGRGAPDPFAPRAPVVCQDRDEIVIDGQVIENAGITITTRGSCKGVTIRNSLIVSGQNAITIVGTTTVTVDSSVIVGQDAAITLRGVVRLSTANSVLHGKEDVRGQVKITDLGGNVFE
jgi:hypothetical protein